MASNWLNLCTFFLGLLLLFLCTRQASCTESQAAAAPEDTDEVYPDYEDTTATVIKRHLGSIAAMSGTRSRFNRFTRPNYITDSSNDDDTYKFKRFLGSLARGGWFPRQFRGFVQPGTGFQKRHIGAVARIGWLPVSRSQQQQDYQF